LIYRYLFDEVRIASQEMFCKRRRREMPEEEGEMPEGEEY
jgi:hypothetical protein